MSYRSYEQDAPCDTLQMPARDKDHARCGEIAMMKSRMHSCCAF